MRERERERERKETVLLGVVGTLKETEAAGIQKKVICVLLVKRELSRDQKLQQNKPWEKGE